MLEQLRDVAVVIHMAGVCFLDEHLLTLVLEHLVESKDVFVPADLGVSPQLSDDGLRVGLQLHFFYADKHPRADFHCQ